MKVAFVHDWLNTKKGGAENVLETMAEMFPDAPIYTLLYNRDNYPELDGRVYESFLRRFPKFMKKRPRYLMPLIPPAIESFDLSGFDIVISSSCAYSKNILTQPETTHISYCHSPARLYWDYWTRYIDEQNVGPIRRGLIRGGATLVRMWDHSGTDRVDVMIANSKTTQKRIDKYYRSSSRVLHPPVNLESCQYRSPQDKDDYYVTLSILTPYKRIDTAIEAFNTSGKKLVVISDGPDRNRLESVASDNIEFTGYVSSQKRAELLAGAKGLIFPNMEDFGISPVEAMASGTPVLAYGKGGVTETITDGKTGVFFDQQTTAGINQAIEQFESIKFDGETLAAHAREFSEDVFKKKLAATIKRSYYDHGETV